MHNGFDFNEISKYLESFGYTVVESDSATITVELDVCGRRVKLRGDIGGSFPISIPNFYLLDRGSYGRLGHVGWHNEVSGSDDDIGLVCHGVTISRSVNFESPEKVFVYGLEAVVQLIKGCLSSDEENTRQILEEFAGHWSFSCKKRDDPDIAIIEPVNEVVPLRVFSAFNQRLYCVHKPPTNCSYQLTDSEFLKGIKHKGLYIPLPKSIYPPSVNEDIYDWWKHQVLKSLSSATIEEIKKHLQKFTSKTKKFSVILRVPTPNSDNFSWCGLDFSNKTKASLPLLSTSSKGLWELSPFQVQIHSQSYLLPRGGASNEVSNKNILVVGCGSVGGEIIRLLGHSGVGRLDLLDYDKLKTDNIYRHVLPSAFIGCKKTDSLVQYMQSKFPYLKMSSYDGHTDLFSLASDPDLENILSKYDGVILSTGDATQERYFNDAIAKLSNRPWAVYSWLEGYGVGGHVVYVHPDNEGCLTCLYRDPITNESSLKNIQNFMDVNQAFAIDTSGCGSHFLPYSYIDVTQTALLAARIVDSALSGNLNLSLRDSWKGSSIKADEAGLKLTKRYYKFKDDGPIDLKWIDCPLCS